MDFKRSSIKKFIPGEQYFISLEHDKTNLLKLPKLAIYWNPEHGIKVLKAVNLFFKTFFIDWCKFTPQETTNFLSFEVKNPNGTFRFISESAKAYVKLANKRWNIDFSYLDFALEK